MWDIAGTGGVAIKEWFALRDGARYHDEWDGARYHDYGDGARYHELWH